MTEAYIGLGSNLARPDKQLATAFTALSQLPQTRFLKRSSIYQSAPVGPAGQADYLNAVAVIDTELSPLSLLNALQAQELKQGRERLQHWGPRTIDLDVLLFGDQEIHSERLTVPHAFLRERAFVLRPLFELDPELRLPCGEAIADLLDAVDESALIRYRPDKECADA
ncbi:MAG: 2-amino-4-hydroxy-6-hydroxymethyldihydropteridine diphosphokinase [Gammaproteobacteria bacterium]|nr:MAG: 2-amino-4-hydroxy-6-hydroxymethyldihydropteridine diphosphokinase [Gammaproteobacteria bacterium]